MDRIGYVLFYIGYGVVWVATIGTIVDCLYVRKYRVKISLLTWAVMAIPAVLIAGLGLILTPSRMSNDHLIQYALLYSIIGLSSGIIRRYR